MFVSFVHTDGQEWKFDKRKQQIRYRKLESYESEWFSNSFEFQDFKILTNREKLKLNY